MPLLTPTQSLASQNFAKSFSKSFDDRAADEARVCTHSLEQGDEFFLQLAMRGNQIKKWNLAFVLIIYVILFSV